MSEITRSGLADGIICIACSPSVASHATEKPCCLQSGEVSISRLRLERTKKSSSTIKIRILLRLAFCNFRQNQLHGRQQLLAREDPHLRRIAEKQM